jgi:hypothetical protein
MENFEKPMTSGTPVIMNSTPASSIETGAIEDREFSENQSFGVSENLEILEQANEEGIADEILTSAKEDGFEKTLEKLADGDFEKEEVLEGEKEEESLQLAENGEEDLETNSLQEVDPEKAALYQQIEELKEQVGDLSKEKFELERRLEKSESLNELSMQTMLEMLKLMQKLAEKEKDEEEVSVLEIMIKLVTFFLQSVVEGDIAEMEKEGQSSKVKNQKKEEEPIDFEAAIKKIQEKKVLKAPQQHVEKQAA